MSFCLSFSWALAAWSGNQAVNASIAHALQAVHFRAPQNGHCVSGLVGAFSGRAGTGQATNTSRGYLIQAQLACIHLHAVTWLTRLKPLDATGAANAQSTVIWWDWK